MSSNHRPFAISLSIAAHHRCALGPSPPRSHRPLPLRSRRAPTLAIKELSRSPSPSRSHHAVPRRPLPSRSRRAIHCRQGAVAPYLTIKEPLSVSTDNSGHLSCPSNLQASHRPAGCRVASPHATTSHLPAPLIAAVTFRASRRSGWLSPHLDSHSATFHLPEPPPLSVLSLPLVTPILSL